MSVKNQTDDQEQSKKIIKFIFHFQYIPIYILNTNHYNLSKSNSNISKKLFR